MNDATNLPNCNTDVEENKRESTKLNANSGCDVHIVFGADFNIIKEATNEMKTQMHSTFLMIAILSSLAPFLGNFPFDSDTVLFINFSCILYISLFQRQSLVTW